MARHVVTIEEMEVCDSSRVIAGSYGNGPRKELVVLTVLSRLVGGSTVTFRVTKQLLSKYEGNDLLKAIEVYNEI
jgi:hypothetical protein